MTFTFRKAARENVHVLLGMIGGTGSGKTKSALRLAHGLAGGKRFALIDTEAKRALHYADEHDFEHGDLVPPFRPGAYLEAILAAEAAGFPVAVVDSFSHEHAGEGGILDWHDEILDRMAGDDWKKREACNMRAWVEPKMDHKRMVQRLLQLRMHLILCFRAEPKVKMQKDDKGKTQIIDSGWQPICAKGMEFELTASFLLSHERPGLPDNPLKLPEQLRPFFPPDRPIDERSGEDLARWAAGGVPRTTPAVSASAAAAPGIVDQLLERIEAAADLAALTQLGQEIQGFKTLGRADHERIQPAYRARQQALRKAATSKGAA